VDLDSEGLSGLFDEQDDAAKWMIESVIIGAHKAGAKIGLCGQAPSDHPEFAEFLVYCGIDSISVSRDSFIAVKAQSRCCGSEIGYGPRGKESCMISCDAVRPPNREF
jgi:pyruvate,water dikinase